MRARLHQSHVINSVPGNYYATSSGAGNSGGLGVLNGPCDWISNVLLMATIVASRTATNARPWNRIGVRPQHLRRLI